MNLTKEGFVEAIQAKMPQAPAKQLAAFYGFHSAQGCPPDFLDKLAGTFRYIDKAEFDAALASAKKYLEQQIGDQSYYFFFEYPRSSARWIYERLLQIGLRSASALYGFNNDLDVEHFERIFEDRKKDDPFVMADDWSIGGAQMVDLATTLVGFTNKNLVPLFITNHARHYINKSSPESKLWSPGKEIETLDRVMGVEDFNYLAHLYTITSGKEDFYPEMLQRSTLLTSDHFTPDNFPDIFVGKRKVKATGEVVPPIMTPVRPVYKRLKYRNTLHRA